MFDETSSVLELVINSKFNCNFYSAALVHGDSCVNSNRVKLALLSKAPTPTPAPIHSNCQSDDLCYSDSFLIYKKQPPESLFHTHFSFRLCKEPSAVYSHLIISKHTLANEYISRPTGKHYSIGLGGCYLNKCLLNLGHYDSASAT